MKRMIAVIIALLTLALSLVACSGSNDAKAVDLDQIITDINTEYGVDGLKALEDTAKLKKYFRIAEEDVKSFAAEMTTAASQYNEVIIVEAIDADAAARIAEKLNSHLDSQTNNARSYDKDTLSMIEGCEVKTKGNYVYLVINEKAAEINSKIDSSL